MLGACTGTTTGAPPPARTPPAPVAVASAATGTGSPPPAATPSVVVVTGYYRVIASPSEVVMTLYRARYGPYHAHLRMVRTRHGWAISSIDRI